MTIRRASAGRPAAIAQASLGFVLTSLGACLVLVARDLRLPTGRLAGLPPSWPPSPATPAYASPS